MTTTTVDGLWVVSDVAVDGSYITTVHAGPDVAIHLDQKHGIRYVQTVIAAAVRAEYDAMALSQQLEMGMSEEAVAHIVAALRDMRPPLDDNATTPIGFKPIVRAGDCEPYVYISLHGETIGRWTPEEARDHATNVLTVLEGTRLDGDYHQLLTKTLGVSDISARLVIGSMLDIHADTNQDD